MELDQDAPGLVGRGSVWARLTALLDPAHPEATGVLLVGEAGIGKTALVASFAAEAARRGHVVARTAGGEGGGRPYAALRDLLGPPGAGVDELPAGQRRALRAALDGVEHGVDLLALRSAVCAVLALRAGDRPVVLVVDDADRVDAPTFDVLLTLAAVISWAQTPVVALFAARTENAPLDLAELLPSIAVPPLTEREAERLLDRVADAPAGGGRLELMRRAAGNPLALREFADWADRPGTARVFVRRVHELPADSLRALTLAAAGERDLAVLAGADPVATLSAWQPAEDAGLVTVADTAVRFTHPLVEQAVLEAAGPDARRRAHRLLAGAATDPYRALWHRAAAADSAVDPALAAELAAAARRLDGAGTLTAVGLLERAGELLPPEQRTTVLFEAAARAAAVGRVRWSAAILDRARHGLDPVTVAALDRNRVALASWLLTMRDRVPEAAALLVDAFGSGWGRADDLLGTAGLPAFLLGEGPLTDALRAELADGDSWAEPAVFPRAVVAPDQRLHDTVLATPVPDDAAGLLGGAAIGAAAMLLDEPEHALRLLDPAVRAVVDGTAAGVFLTAPNAAVWALIDTGQWVAAEQRLVPLLSSPVTAEATQVRAGTRLQLAVIAYGRGRPDAAAGQLDRTDSPWSPALVFRLRWAQGLAAAAGGDHQEAYRLLGEAVHGPAHFWQLLALPDLITAAVHIGTRDEAVALAARVRDRFAGRWTSERTGRRLAAAGALALDDPAVAAQRLGELLDAPGARRWPFERAVLAVDLADRLRRAHQPRPARETLVDALDTFERLHAAGWAARVRAELRAEASDEPDPFARLSAQQEQIARLAADGLTNREIGTRLFLSPRTVGSHLYRMFPLLGVANRTQLSELLAARDRQRPAGAAG